MWRAEDTFSPDELIYHLNCRLVLYKNVTLQEEVRPRGANTCNLLVPMTQPQRRRVLRLPPQWQRCLLRVPPLPPLIKAGVDETHLYGRRETMPTLPSPRLIFSIKTGPLSKNPCAPFVMLKRRWKISNSIWAEPRAGQLYGPPLFRPGPLGRR